MRIFTSSVGVMGLSLAIVAGASAATITINNASFETPDAAGSSNSGTVTGWTESATATNIGTMDQDYASGSDSTPNAPDGTQWLYIRASSTDTSNTATQLLADKIVANQVYTLNLTIGENYNANMSLATPVGNFTFGLYTDDGQSSTPTIALASGTNGDVTFGINHTAAATVTFDSTGSQYVGGNLYVYLQSDYTTKTTRTLFDAVSLTAVPEPASLALLGLGGLLALGHRRRRGA